LANWRVFIHTPAIVKLYKVELAISLLGYHWIKFK
jgi:hypothetical protein